MIEMQMRHDQMRHVTGLQSERAQMLRQPSVAMIEDLTFDRTEAIADSRIDKNRVAPPHYKRTGQVEPDTVAIVRLMVALPEFARHHAEHASAVIAPKPIGEECDSERADFYFRWYLSHLASLTS